MKEESDIPLLKSYNKDTTIIETDPFMEKEIDELIRAYTKPAKQAMEFAVSGGTVGAVSNP